MYLLTETENIIPMPVLASLNDIYRVRTSAQDIIKEALELIGVLDPSEPLSAADLTSALRTFNFMLDSWNTEKLTIYALVRNSLTLTAGQQSHTVGPAGDLDIPRPQSIEQGQAFITGGTLGTTEREIEIYNQHQWAAILDKSTSSIPSRLYYETAFPLGVIWLDPKPDVAYSLLLYTEQMLAQAFMDSVNSDVALPPGYAEAIVHNLAIRLAPEFGKEPPAAVIEGAVTGKANIKRANQKPVYLSMDSAIVGAGRWDITTGEFV